MAVNTNFYAVANELFSRATSGAISATQVVDYDTFVDAGKVLADMTYEDLQNTLIADIMNKVQKTIHDCPAYMGQLLNMDKGTLDYGVLEILVDDFYSANASVWDGNTIAEGNTYTDQFKVENLPNTTARYYTESDSWGFDITIRDTDIKGAFVSPEKFDAFIRTVFTQVMNSIEAHKELVRMSVLAAVIKECDGVTAEDSDENAAAVHYDLLSIYNGLKNTTLNYENCLLSNDFVSWSVGVIRDVCLLMEKPSQSFSVNGDVVTFTPAGYRDVLINGVYDKAIRRSLIDAYNQQYGMLDMNYEVLPYWQNSADRLRVTTNETPAGAAAVVTTYSEGVLAVVKDNRCCGILTQLDDVTTDRNGKRRYTNYHFQLNWKLYTMLSANSVIFTIGDPTPAAT